MDARDTANKLKSRWRTKMFAHEDSSGHKKSAPKSNLDEEVNDFLRPSTDRAHAQKEAATQAFLAAAKPRIDVAKAQRWPGANDVLGTSAGKSTGIGGMKSGQRKRGLTVDFSRAQPDVIGEGGDECQEPSIEVSRRRRAHTSAYEGSAQGQKHQDDIHVGAQSFNPANSSQKEAERRGIVTRTSTSHGELSPPLQQKMEMGRINTHATPPPVPPRGLGPMGLGERPRLLQRAPTGFDIAQDAAPSRPSLDSAYSNDSENVSPIVSKKAPSLAPTLEEEDDFRPKRLQRSATGWSEHQGDPDDEAPPPLLKARHLPGMSSRDDNSSLESNSNHFLESESVDSDSYSARVIHKMRADEGRALHEAAARRAAEATMGDSVSSTDSFTPAMKSSAVQIGTPPAQFTVPLAGKTPPRLRSRESPPRRASPQRPAGTDYDPYRPDTTGRTSPRRRPMPPGAFPLDTEVRPQSSASSQYTIPSAASRTRASPTRPSMDSTTGSLPRAHRSHERVPPSGSSQQSEVLSASSETSILPTPPQFERHEYMAPLEPKPTRAPPPDARTIPPRRDTVNEPPQNARKEPASSKTLARSDTKSQGEDAFADFTERVQHMQGIFMLTAQLAGQLYDHTPMQWLRVATWWFLKGRTGMEHLIRSRPKDGGPQPERLTQPHVDLAKTWWIITEIIQNHPSLKRYGEQKTGSQAKLTRDAGDSVSAETYELRDAILSSLKMLLGSMKRHQSMPPTQALIQGQDQSIWVEYPKFAPDAHSVLAGTASKSVLAKGPGQRQSNPATLIPVGDTATSFCYFRMFVNASLSTDDPSTDRVPLPLVISVLRPRDGFQLNLSVCSQSELVNVVVGSNPDDGPTWRDVGWRPQSCGINIQLKHNFSLSIVLSEQDFRSLRAIVDHTNRVEANLRERADERMCAKMYLRDFAYVDSTNPGAFPPGRVPGCKLMVFQKFERSSEGTGRRKLHRGYRLVVVTNAKNRTLSCVNHEMGTNQEPMDFGYLTDSDNAPGLTLKFKEETADKKKKLCTMTIFFNDPKERNHLFGTFTSMNQTQNEAVFAQVPLKAFSIESADAAGGFSQSGRDVLKRLQWMEAKALNMDPEATGLEAAPTVMSESLRIVCRHSAGIISDRMNLGPGDLLVRLPTDGAAELTLLRDPQHDMAVAIDSSRTDNDVPEALAELLRTLTTASTIRRLTFNSYKDLHDFQLAVTGFQVMFDGIASTFSVSRRRMVVPIYKQWTANTIRIQVVQQDNIIQLLAFFEDFSHADAMNFQLKSMDVFEKTEKGGKACVRLVDAKFALPVEERRGEGKMGKEEGKISGWAGMKRRFVCLDQIEYPGEHDDILIAFDSAETRDRFADALPAAAQVGRKFTVRRKY